MRRVYKLMDYNNKTVKCSKYLKEIKEILDNQFCIEKVLRRRTLLSNTKNLFDRWLGWPDKYNR